MCPRGDIFFMSSLSLKEPTTIDEQLDILLERGCTISDADFCKEVLSKINYYRLSAYFLPFKTLNGDYRNGVSFEQIYKTYEFDRSVRRLILSAVEVVEVNLRAKFSNYHARKYGKLGYLDSENFNNRHVHDDYIKHISDTIRKNMTMPFVRHHNDKYGGQFPFWVIIDLFTFGMLSRFFADLKQADQRSLSQVIAGVNPAVMVSWLRCCTDLRNMCAHYGRLYYRIFPAIPSSLPESLKFAERRLFGVLWALKHLYPDVNKWRTEVVHPLSMLITEYESAINLKHIGFPTGWESLLM